jgi:hypothetical protein
MNEMHKEQQAADKREEIHFSVYSKKNTGNSPKQNHAFSGTHKHSKTKHSYSVSFFLLSTRQMDKKSNTPPTSDTVFLFLGEKRRSIKDLFAFKKSAKVAIFRH